MDYLFWVPIIVQCYNYVFLQFPDGSSTEEVISDGDGEHLFSACRPTTEMYVINYCVYNNTYLYQYIYKLHMIFDFSHFSYIPNQSITSQMAY